MSFKQSVHLDKQKLKVLLESTLKEEVQSVGSEFEGSGSTGGVNTLEVQLVNGEMKKYILKKSDSDYDYMSFYIQVLAPYNLSHPLIVDEVEYEGAKFMLMEFIERQVEKWTQEKYLAAIEWLVFKDKVMSNSIGKLGKYSFIGKRVSDRGFIEHFEQTIPEGIRGSIHPILTLEYYERLKHLRDRYNKAFSVYNEEPLTVCHIDFCENNVLFEKDTNKIFVIDWCYPQIGSIFLDLAEILKSTDSDTFEKALTKYAQLSNIDFSKIKEGMSQAKLIQNFMYLGWVIKSKLNGILEIDDPKAFENLALKVVDLQ